MIVAVVKKIIGSLLKHLKFLYSKKFGHVYVISPNIRYVVNFLGILLYCFYILCT